MPLSDKEFLRLCPISITVARGQKMKSADLALLKRALPLWTGGYVSEKVTAEGGFATTRIALTDTGRAELSRPA